MTTNGTIVIVGAGVIGLTTAVTLQEAGRQVHVIAEEIPGRTSLAAGAMWGPYLVEPWKKVREWSLVSLAAFTDLAYDTPNTGVRLTTGIEAARHPMPAPEWSELLPDFRPCTHDELPAGFEAGHRFTVPLIDMPVYLAYLQRRYESAGGTLEQRTLASLDDVTGAEAIVNCSGMGATDLADDLELRPVHGLHVVIENPGITEFFSEDTGYSPELVCTYPHGDTIVLGGTAVDDEHLTEALEPAARAIIDRNATIDPRLAKARVIEHRVGMRPTRPEVRVEAGKRHDGTPVIHNYGHGGAGVTLSWGCAREVATVLTAPAHR